VPGGHSTSEDRADETLALDETRNDNRPVEARRSAGQTLGASAAAQTGLRHIAELTGKQVNGVASVEPAQDGWIVGVEVVEERRIPSSADILGLYEVEIDIDGTLLAYRRLKRYLRGRGNDGGAG